MRGLHTFIPEILLIFLGCVAIIVTGTIALTIAATFVFLGIHEFIGLVIEQGIEGLLDTVAAKIFKIVLYEILVQLYNVARRSYCLLSAIRVVVT